MNGEAKLTTTLAAIRAHGPCAPGWDKLKEALGPDWDDDAAIPLTRILESNGASDAIWALRACAPEADRDRISRLLACRCAERALALVADPDPRSVAAVQISRRFALGRATADELSAAGDAASDAARTAALTAARTASDAAWAAAGCDLLDLMTNGGEA